jgi:Signal transduction histidine kinase
MVKNIILISFLLLYAINVCGQSENSELDSLINASKSSEISSSDKLLLYNNIYRIAYKRDIDIAILYSRMGFELAEKVKNDHYYSYFAENIGVYYFSNMKYDSSYIYFEKALEVALKTNDKKREASLYTRIARWNITQSKNVTALEWLLKALKITEELDDVFQTLIIVEDIGGLYEILGNETLALEYFERVISISDKHNLPEKKMKSFYHMSLIYLDKGEIENALDYAQKTIDQSILYNNRIFEIAGLDAMTEIYHYGLHDYEKALEYAEKCLQLTEKQNNPAMYSGILKSISNIYRYQRRYKECEETALRAYNMDSLDLEKGSDLTFNIALSNAFLGNHDKADLYISKFVSILEQQNNEKFQEKMSEMEAIYQTEKKEIRIATLEKEKQFFFLYGVVGFILLLLAYGVLFYRHRLNMQNQKNLEQQNILAEKELKLFEQKNEIARQQIIQLEQEKILIATYSVLAGEMKERKRLAQDLHDRLSGSLSAMRIELSGHYDQSVRDKLDNCINEIRETAHNMMPSSLRYGMKLALEDFAIQFPMLQFHFFGIEKRIDEKIEYVVYCCANELVNNAIKHSSAKKINMQLIQNDEFITLTVSDDGCGFDVDENNTKKGLGLKSIYARVLSCNGKIDINSSAEKGTEICIEIGL